MDRTKTIAIMYDFDQTLSVDCMDNYGLFQYLELKDDEFYKAITEMSKKYNMDRILAFLLMLNERAKQLKKPLTAEIMQACGKNIEYFKGVRSWFNRINKFGKEHGFQIEHYVISSGMYQVIKGSDIFKYFKKVYACDYVYDKNGKILWPALSINYTNKTQFIFRICKGIFDVTDDSINDYMADELRPLKDENMIYIGDGLTDIPCMKVIRGKKGLAIAVYDENNKEKVAKMLEHGRVSNICKADYREGKDIDKLIKKFIIELAERQK